MQWHKSQQCYLSWTRLREIYFFCIHADYDALSLLQAAAVQCTSPSQLGRSHCRLAAGCCVRFAFECICCRHRSCRWAPQSNYNNADDLRARTTVYCLVRVFVRPVPAAAAAGVRSIRHFAATFPRSSCARNDDRVTYAIRCLFYSPRWTVHLCFHRRFFRPKVMAVNGNVEGTAPNKVTVVLGAQWGDEGKGKVVDMLATDADLVCRCQVRSVLYRIL